MSKLAQELEVKRQMRAFKRTVARRVAEVQAEDMTPEQLREYAIRYLTHKYLFEQNAATPREE